MTLTEHARRELERIEEDPWLIDGLVKVVEAFAAMGHSGASAGYTRSVLHDLLAYKPLSPLTDDPAEWIDHTEISGGVPTWQSIRNPEAFSNDWGRTYYLLSEQAVAPSPDLTPLHQCEPRVPTKAAP